MGERKRRRAYFDVNKIIQVLNIINSHCQEKIKMRLVVGNCAELDNSSIWYVHFDATDREWMMITEDLNELGDVTIKTF